MREKKREMDAEGERVNSQQCWNTNWPEEING